MPKILIFSICNDYDMILVKVALILAIYGGLRSEELCNLEYDDLKLIEGSYAIRKSKTDQEKAGFV